MAVHSAKEHCRFDLDNGVGNRIDPHGEITKWTDFGPANNGSRSPTATRRARFLEKQNDETRKARMRIWNMDPES